MSIIGSSARTAGIGSLFKMGVLAAATYLILKRIKGKQTSDLMPDQVPDQELTHSYVRDYPAPEKPIAHKIKIDSSTSSPAAATLDNLTGLGKRHTIVITSIDEGSDKQGSTKRLITERIPDSTTEGDLATSDLPPEIETPHRISAKIKEPPSIQELDDTLSTYLPEASAGQSGALRAENAKRSEKLAAIETVGSMAADGNQEALDLLYKHANNEDLSVRQSAIRELLTYGGKDAREHLQDSLPAGDWYMMDIRLEDMRRGW